MHIAVWYTRCHVVCALRRSSVHHSRVTCRWDAFVLAVEKCQFCHQRTLSPSSRKNQKETLLMGGCGVINYAPLFTMFIVQQVYSTLGIYLIKNYEEVLTALMFYIFYRAQMISNKVYLP